MERGRRQSGVLVHSAIPSGSSPLGSMAMSEWLMSKGGEPESGPAMSWASSARTVSADGA
eukprot:825202-Pyramimonas_sp.AAC.1